MTKDYFAVYRPYDNTCLDHEADMYIRFNSKSQRDDVVERHWKNYEACTRRDVPKNKSVIDYKYY